MERHSPRIDRERRAIRRRDATTNFKSGSTVMIYDSILDTIGNTPVIRLHRTGPDHVELYVKVESFNPMASVKDRLAYAIIRDAENKGALKAGQTVIEATSGNTGIALAMVCAARGYPFVSVMAESFSIERRKIMKALGAKVLLTPAAERATGMVRLAEELAERHGWFLAQQFENPANPAYHRNTTGPEILKDFAARRLDYWVTGYGTGGTMTGAGEMIKVARPDVKIIATEPAGAALLMGKEWHPHKIQGWTPDFIPDVLNHDVYDDIVPVTDEESRDTSLELARNEGIFVGISAGGTLAAALKVAEQAPEGSVILAMLPDTGERYLSTFLFEDISEDSDIDWLKSLESRN
jgi:cysteine synthase A